MAALKSARPSPQRLRILGTVALVLAVLVVEGVGVGAAFRRYERALAELVWIERRAESLTRLIPAPTEENAQHLNVAIERLAAQVDSVRRAGRSSVSPSPVPTSRAEAYFALQAYASRLRSLAAGHGVEHPPAETWGFDSYRREGPADDLRERVHRQSRDLEELLAALLRTKPVRIERIQRESPEGDTRDARRVNLHDADIFVLPPSLRLDAGPVGAACAYRVTFVGTTSTLKNWVNALSGLHGPAVIRDVSAEPVSASDRSQPPGATWPQATRFTVVVAILANSVEP